MDSESSQSTLTMRRKKSHRNRRLQSSSDSTSNESDSSASLMQVNFDALKNHTPSKADVDKSNEIDPLSLPSEATNAQNNNDASDNDENSEKSSSNRVHNHTDTEIVENDVKQVFRIKLVPLEKLLSHNKEIIREPQCQPVELSSESSSDQPLIDLIKETKQSPKKRFSKTRRSTAHKSNCIDTSSNESDSNEFDTVTTVRQTKSKPESNVNHDIRQVKVQLNRLPSNLEPLLERYNLCEIRDRHQNILVSRKKSHRNEVHKKKNTNHHFIQLQKKKMFQLFFPLPTNDICKLHFISNSLQFIYVD